MLTSPGNIPRSNNTPKNHFITCDMHHHFLLHNYNPVVAILFTVYCILVYLCIAFLKDDLKYSLSANCLLGTSPKKGTTMWFYLWKQTHREYGCQMCTDGLCLKWFNLIFARWPETLVDSKTQKPSQKKGAKVCDTSPHLHSLLENINTVLENAGQIAYEGGIQLWTTLVPF